MSIRPHSWRAILLLAGLTLLLALGACVRLRESSPANPGAAGNIAKAQVVTTASPETPPAATAVATQENDAATAVASPAETPSPATTAVAATPTPVPCQFGAFEDELDVDIEELDSGDGGPRNAIKVCNRKDNRLRIRGRIQLNRIPGDTARPVNQSLAWNSCVGCRSISVALQMNLLSRTASTIAPRNEAFAFNFRCKGCVAVALSYQFNHQVDNPQEVPENVRRLVQDLDAELHALHSEKDVSLEQAIQRIQAVIDRFFELNASLDQRRQEARDDDTPGSGPG